MLTGRRLVGATPGGFVTRVAVVCWLAVFGVYLAVKGIPYTTDDVMVWLFTLVVCLSLGDLRRAGPRALRDWLPLAGLLILYNRLRGYSTTMHWVPHFQPQLAIDRALGGGQVLTVRLQDWLWNPHHLRVWDYASLFVYLTHFVAAFVIAAVLWKVNYPRFCRFMWMYLILTFFGFVTFVLFPAQPPWMVANEYHHLPHLTRIITVVLDHVHLHLASAIMLKGSAYANPVAAMPSLHAGYPLLIALVFWKTARWWLRIILAAYPLLMAFALVYAAEHFVIDVLAGWAYAAVTYAVLSPVFDWWQSRELSPFRFLRLEPTRVPLGGGSPPAPVGLPEGAS